ncbi:hypothetical protein [Flavobacterium sp. J27]|uniref:hypothetical protein n=1 Tax=Flavobacterium sp. J27 TaxID=2060419 RepID=UPI00103189CD|nr:hypothetical protein [Flavobacterium sp. J27]
MQQKLKRMLFLGILLYASCVFSQEKNHFSQEEIQTFIKIYKHQLDHPFDIATSMEKALEKTTLSKERMTVILQAQFAGNEIVLTDAEKKELETIKAFMEKDNALHKANLNALVNANNMKTSRYHEIENYFHNNTDFQNKVAQLYNKQSN